MTPFQLLPSTTSHKHEPLLPTLAIFARLGFCDLDLNLNHLIERGVTVPDVQRALAENQQRAWVVSGGWCDFFDRDPEIEATFSSVARQVEMARALGAVMLRLFFGRLEYERYSADARTVIVGNIRRVADAYPDIRFVFENHDGASSHPSVCREILEAVERPHVRLNFDPINFEHRGVSSLEAAHELQSLIAHVHLKGYERGGFCEFGVGDVDLTPVLRELVNGGYRGAFTVEYEGAFDRTLHLYESVRRARLALEELSGSAEL
ncbi:MAG TPA: sugar phosphate isomerase/epimerase [Vicinamibacterales bacterium]|nr:sugar phosphate isomerase/epimerase [Vicinamibacterales bacterium]